MRFSSTLLLMLALGRRSDICRRRGSPGQPPPKPRRNGLPPTIRPPTRWPPTKLAKAVALDRTRIVLTVAASGVVAAAVVVVAGHGAVARMRDFAAGLSKRRWLQCYVSWVACCSPLPCSICHWESNGHWVALRDGLSVQAGAAGWATGVSCWGLNGASAGWWRC